MTINRELEWILISFLLLSVQVARAIWNDPPFLAADPEEEEVEFISSSSGRTNIKLQEEVEREICIAQVNYDGMEIPQIGSFASGQSNFILGGEFRKNTATDKWELFITKKQDYETPVMQSYRFQVIIGTERSDVALNIINIDDNPPVIQPVDRNCMIEENFHGRSNCSFIISDADGWIDKTQISYTSTPNEGLEHFEFVPEFEENNEYEMKAHLDVTKDLDFETITTYMLQIKATDSGKNEGTLMSVIQVIDMPDEPPVWTSLTASKTIVEKSENSLQVVAVDGDIQIDAEINYRIEAEDAGEKDLFSIDTKTGLIKISKIDRDTRKKEVFRFTVVAYEKENITSAIDATIVILVEDLNDHSPEIKPDVLKIDIEEETYMTLEFEDPIVITDPDLAENGQYSVELVDKSEYKWSSAFMIVPNSGYQTGTFTISVVNASLLDYEDEHWRNIQIDIEAKELANATHVGRKTVEINLINWNDEEPIFEEPTVEVSIPEDVEANYFIATMLATDRDVGDEVTHELMFQRALTMDKKTGDISTAKNDALDYESMPVVVVQVVAKDKADHKAYATLTINVIDVNDVPPQLYLPKEIPSLVEEGEKGTVVDVKIEASDVDTEADLVFSIDWDKTTAQKSGVLVAEEFYRGHLGIETIFPEEHHRSAEAKITVTDRIDYERFDVMFLTIVITDTTTVHNDNSTSASLTLNIIDINDNKPQFNEFEALKVTENAVTDTLIGSVTATDADGPQYNQISYYVKAVNGTEDELISIDRKTGTIKVDLNQTIDAEKYEYLYYEIIASDGLWNTTQPLPIYVIDVNDEVPYLISQESDLTIHIREKSPTGTEIVTVSAKDDDRTYPYNNVSYLINQNYTGLFQYFELSRFGGVLKVNLADGYELDRDFGAPKYTLNLKLRDNYLEDGITWNTNAIDTTIEVILDDINDQIPKLPDMGNPAEHISENDKKDTVVLKVVAEDKDDPATDNTKVSYDILGISLVDEDIEVEEKCKDLFKVKTEDNKSAIITAARELRGCYGTWAVELHAKDHGTDPRPQEDTRIYNIKVTDYNYNDPVITFPAAGTNLGLSQDQTLHTRLKTHDKQPLPDFTATDADFGASGNVTFSISSPSDDDQFFEVIETKKNSAQLQLKKWPQDIEENGQYQITVKATDNGNPARSVSREVKIVFVSTLGPKFKENEWTVWIHENKTGLDFSAEIPEAFDNINDGGANIVPIYYFIDNKVGDYEYFALDKSTRILTVAKELDREQQEIMNISVITTADKDGPPRDPRPEAILTITVIVLDVNDNPPVFESGFYSGGVAVEDKLDKLILTVTATDADLNDTLRYSLDENSLTHSDPSISSLKKPFSLNAETGEITLKFSATSNMAGFFKFNIMVYDEVDHSDKTTVQIYIIENSNRVVFTFRNNAAFVSAEKMFVIETFSNTFGYICNIDDIKSSVDANNHVLDNVTTITTHFINSKDNLPIDANAVILASSDLQTVTNLKANLQGRGLFLIDVPTGSSSEVSDNEDRVYWVLVSLTIIFSLSTIALFVIYFVRTRQLNQRLDKMAVDWQNEDDEGRKTNGFVPTTNQFAIAGSNPVWNITRKEDDKLSFGDNVSHRSGDSDLIGIEDNPNFGYRNEGFVSEKEPRINDDNNEPFATSNPVLFLDSRYNNRNHEDKC